MSQVAPDPCRDLPERAPLADGERIRVVELLASGTNGGAQEHVAALLSQIDRDRYDVRVLSLSDGSAVRRWRSLGFEVDVLDGADEGATVDGVVACLGSWRSQVLHCHMHRAEVVGTRAALRCGAMGRSRPFVISHVHSSRVRSAEDRAVLAALTPSMDRLVAVSRATVAMVEAERPSRPPVELIYNGVDLARYDRTEACCTLPEEYGFEPGTPLVGCVARLEPEKGHPTLLEAWPLVLERVPGARLLVIGEGSRCDALMSQAESLGLLGDAPLDGGGVGTRHARPNARVVFTGRREDVPSVTAALDVAVLPSYREAQGLVILEAMALSRPVVATRVGGIPEMVEDGVTGLLVPPRDPVALAGAIVRLLGDHPLADTIARAGHDLVHSRFCLERMTSAICDLYDEGAAAWRERYRATTEAAGPGHARRERAQARTAAQ